ncbi:MAG: hypothetical protein E7588_10260 [Ruminococcaceae bacterium]|nr:hypothetical protein [Oscillospiraceae bacterium]
MKLKKILSLILVAVILCVSAYAATSVYDCISIGGIEDEDGGAFAIVCDSEKPEGYGAWGLGTITQYTEAQAQAKNVPEGYDGSVYMVELYDGSLGFTLDFSVANIPVANVKSITMNIYPVHDVTSGGKIQLYTPAPTSGWRTAYPLENNFGTDKWINFTLGSDYGWRFSNGFVNNAELKDADGMLDKINFMFTNASTLYIDSIEVEYYPVSVVSGDGTTALASNIKKFPYVGEDDRASAYSQYNYVNYPTGYENIKAPAGYSGTVQEFSAVSGNGKNLGFVVDLTAMNVDAEDVESVTLRIAGNGVPSYIYINNNPNFSSSGYAMTLTDSQAENNTAIGNQKWADVKEAFGKSEWCDLVIDANAFRIGNSFTKNLAEANGKLTNMKFRVSGISEVYLDSISIQLVGGKTIDGEMLGAQVRTTGEKGLRFGTRIATNGNFNLDDVQFVSEDDKLYAGTLVVAKADLAAAGLEANELTHANMKAAEALDVKAAKIFDSAYNTTNALYTAVVYNIPDDTAEIVARGYIRYTADNGITYKYFYFDPVTKSMAAVNESAWGK